MPIYEYRCAECGHEMSHFHRRRSDPKPPCEECGEDALEKLISLSSFSLKGDGWYVTDYKSKGSPAANGSSDSSGSPDSNGSSESGKSSGSDGGGSAVAASSSSESSSKNTASAGSSADAA